MIKKFYLTVVFLFLLGMFNLGAEEQKNIQTDSVIKERKEIEKKSEIAVQEETEKKSESPAQVQPPVSEESPEQITEKKISDSQQKTAEEQKQSVNQNQSLPSISEDQSFKEKIGVPAVSEPVKIAEYVTPLKDLIILYEQETASAKKLIDRWNSRFQLVLQKQSNLKSEIDSANKELADKKTAGERKNKKEISRIAKQIDRLAKEEKALKKEIQALCKELANEIGQVGKETQSVVGEKFRQVQKSVEMQSPK